MIVTRYEACSSRRCRSGDLEVRLYSRLLLLLCLLALEFGFGLELGRALLGPPLEPFIRVELRKLVPFGRHRSVKTNVDQDDTTTEVTQGHDQDGQTQR